MMNNTIKTQEYSCPCCGEKFYIQINESGKIIITPFIIPKENYISIGQYDFGEKGGETNEQLRDVL